MPDTQTVDARPGRPGAGEITDFQAAQLMARLRALDGTTRAGGLPPVLSVRQPWCWLILHAGKEIENRSWATPYRGPLLLHAGQAVDPAGRYAPLLPGEPRPPESLQRGGIVGVVDLVAIRPSLSRWSVPGERHWLLANPRPLPFLATKGRLGVFRLTIVPT